MYDVIIIGGGPAGLMVAHQLSLHQIKFLLLEKNERAGKKILLTGGKRCNVTNILSKDEFIASLTLKHKKFLYHTLNHFGPIQVIKFFKDLQLDLELDKDGFKYFPSTQKSESVLNALLKPIKDDQVITSCKVNSIHKEGEIFKVLTNQGMYETKKVVVATGSQSYPHTGSSGDGLLIAQSFNIAYKPFSSAETYIYTKNALNELKILQGTSLIESRLKVPSMQLNVEGGLIFTHFGLSGPLIMYASEFIEDALAKGSHTIFISLTQHSVLEMTQSLEQAMQQQMSILKWLESITQKKIAAFILNQLEIGQKPIREISKKNLNKIIELLNAYPIEVTHVESKEKAFVNKGGILHTALDPKTFMSKEVSNLYFIGETVDVHGPIGGYNITMALSMGYTASKSLIND